MAIPDPTEAPCLVISAWESPYVTDPHRFAMLLAAIHACDAAHGVRWSPKISAADPTAWRIARAPLLRELQSLLASTETPSEVLH